ncbi:hypothetical protein TWF506_000900 [Arthrobotrys conoides]|uniref:Uncharacterized protein n=1 Tax=Arthrobotrys conoides TaxID=74498 RepID=A0AAN8RXZ4_9PEZI
MRATAFGNNHYHVGRYKTDHRPQPDALLSSSQYEHPPVLSPKAIASIVLKLRALVT